MNHEIHRTVAIGTQPGDGVALALFPVLGVQIFGQCGDGGAGRESLDRHGHSESFLEHSGQLHRRQRASAEVGEPIQPARPVDVEHGFPRVADPALHRPHWAAAQSLWPDSTHRTVRTVVVSPQDGLEDFAAVVAGKGVDEDY